MEKAIRTGVAPAMIGIPATLILSLSDNVRELADQIVEQERGGDLTGVASVTRQLGFIQGKLAIWCDNARSAIAYETELRAQVAERELQAADEAQRLRQPVVLGNGATGAPPFENGVHGVEDGSIERVVEGLERIREERELRSGLGAINRGDPDALEGDATENPLR